MRDTDKIVLLTIVVVVGVIFALIVLDRPKIAPPSPTIAEPIEYEAPPIAPDFEGKG